jgi:hypothetical protein
VTAKFTFSSAPPDYICQGDSSYTLDLQKQVCIIEFDTCQAGIHYLFLGLQSDEINDVSWKLDIYETSTISY